MMNIAAVPILNITLRNNLLDVIPIKPVIRKHKRCMCLLNDHKKSIKGLWSIILSIPVFIIVFLTRDVQGLVTYTGGFCGTFILLIFPAILVYYARKVKSEEKHGQENPNKSPFTSKLWIYFTLFWATVTISCVLVNIIIGGGGGH